ncbi:MAG: 2-phospho-L-lactate transferase [Promethearchaeia archaeon]
MQDDNYVILAGGVGAAKFIDGLRHVCDPKNLKIIINTGDDIELFGLKICPDLDIITYTLGNVVNKDKGWGFQGESFNCLSILKKYYDLGWFNLGDKDLATHIYRTDLLKKGISKAEATKRICEKLNISADLIPMCNEDVQTFIKTPEEKMHFEKFYIKYQCEPKILDVEFKGIKNAKPINQVMNYLENATKIIIAPSNPIVSIGTILEVEGIRAKLKELNEKVYAISPIIQGTSVKGPADKLLDAMGYDATCRGVAKYYKDILGHLIIDKRDCKQKARIKELGLKVSCYDTLMINLEKKKELAQFVLDLS